LTNLNIELISTCKGFIDNQVRDLEW